MAYGRDGRRELVRFDLSDLRSSEQRRATNFNP
jgi:hypothetical protein